MDIIKQIFYFLYDKVIFIANNTEAIKNCAIIFLNITTGVSIIKGLGYLKNYKEKITSTTFTFWSQYNLMLLEIKKMLENDYSLINNLYSSEIRNTWENELTPNEDKIKIFYNHVTDLLDYLKSAKDQMPAYKGWTDDFKKHINFLTDLVQYDIRDSKTRFKFEAIIELSQRDKYVNEQIGIINNLSNGILKKQNLVEEKLYS